MFGSFARRLRSRHLLTAGLLLAWGGGLAWAFWWYDGRYLRSFERPAYFNAEAVQPPFPIGQVQVLHVWQSGCPCNAGHQDYLAEMTARFGAQGVMFARAGPQDSAGLPAALVGLPYWPLPEAWSTWPGAPAVAIWDAAGQLSYVGPYSDGAHCNSDSSFIEPVIQALLAGRSVRINTQDTVSCLCDIQQSGGG